MSAQKLIKVEITGKVQGVYFRKSAKMKADELGLYGFVENSDNGAVYLEAEGNIDALEDMIQWCHKGSERAEVKDVILFAFDELKGYGEFEIRRGELG